MITITDLSTGWVPFTKNKKEGGREILYMMLRKEWMHYRGIAFFLPPQIYVLCHVHIVLASFISVPSDLSHLCWKHLALKLNKEKKSLVLMNGTTPWIVKVFPLTWERVDWFFNTLPSSNSLWDVLWSISYVHFKRSSPLSFSFLCEQPGILPAVLNHPHVPQDSMVVELRFLGKAHLVLVALQTISREC